MERHAATAGAAASGTCRHEPLLAHGTLEPQSALAAGSSSARREFWVPSLDVLQAGKVEPPPKEIDNLLPACIEPASPLVFHGDDPAATRPKD